MGPGLQLLMQDVRQHEYRYLGALLVQGVRKEGESSHCLLQYNLLTAHGVLWVMPIIIITQLWCVMSFKSHLMTNTKTSRSYGNLCLLHMDITLIIVCYHMAWYCNMKLFLSL